MKRVVLGIIKRSGSDNQESYLLVCSNKDFGRFTGHYYPPGGHVEDREDEKECLAREVKEEVGLDMINCWKVTESPGDVPDQITSWYECEVGSFNLVVDKGELDDARFFNKEEIMRLKLWPATKKFFEKFIFR